MRHLSARLARSYHRRALTTSRSSAQPIPCSSTLSPVTRSQALSAGATHCSQSGDRDDGHDTHVHGRLYRDLDTNASRSHTRPFSTSSTRSSTRASDRDSDLVSIDQHLSDDPHASLFSSTYLPAGGKRKTTPDFAPRQGHFMRSTDEVDLSLLPDEDGLLVEKAASSTTRRPERPQSAKYDREQAARSSDNTHRAPNHARPADNGSAAREAAPVHAQQLDQPRSLVFAGCKVHLHHGYLVLDTDDPKPESRSLSYAQLRELCQCDQCLHPTTKQRRRTTGQLYKEVMDGGILDAAPDESRMWQDGEYLAVRWSRDDDGHVSKFDANALVAPRSSTSMSMTLKYPFIRWNLEGFDLTQPRSRPFAHIFPHSGESAPDPKAFKSALRALQLHGICRITGVPTSATDNASCALRHVATAIGPLRNTFYGDLWNVKNMPDSKNIAYTDLDLGLHMDLLYHELPPRFQLLHCLRNRVEGGESYFVDSFTVAHDFINKHPKEAELLRKPRMTFEYFNDGHAFLQTRAILPPDFEDLRAAISWSPPFQGFARPPPDTRIPRHMLSRIQRDRMELQLEYMRAVAMWEDALATTTYRMEFKMDEGDLVLFDNRRVLHARRAFRDYSETERQERGIEIAKGESSRWLKGCYLDQEAIIDKLIQLDGVAAS